MVSIVQSNAEDASNWELADGGEDRQAAYLGQVVVHGIGSVNGLMRLTVLTRQASPQRGFNPSLKAKNTSKSAVISTHLES